MGIGAALGLCRAAGWRAGLAASTVTAAVTARVAGSVPMAAPLITDPRQWSAADWLSDIVPHAAYGMLTAWALARLDSA